RWMFGVNETFYDYALEPVARGYRNTVHEHLRIGIKNIFNNALAPVKFVSSLLQLEFKKSGRVLARTLINTTVGIGGIADVAGEEYGIEDVNEDFDQALGYYGIPTGPYVVLPFFGPATARNIIGRTADALLSPGAMSGASFGTNVIISGEDNVNAASFIVDDKKQLEDSALDEYESVRDFYHQYRHGLLKK
nr:VacJ family lipoprotein [Nitrospinota bacterium]